MGENTGALHQVDLAVDLEVTFLDHRGSWPECKELIGGPVKRDAVVDFVKDAGLGLWVAQRGAGAADGYLVHVSWDRVAAGEVFPRGNAVLAVPFTLVCEYTGDMSDDAEETFVVMATSFEQALEMVANHKIPYIQSSLDDEDGEVMDAEYVWGEYMRCLAAFHGAPAPVTLRHGLDWQDDRTFLPVPDTSKGD